MTAILMLAGGLAVKYFLNSSMFDLLAFCQSGTGMEKKHRYQNQSSTWKSETVWNFFGLVYDWDDGCQNADADTSLFDADAQLSYMGREGENVYFRIAIINYSQLSCY